MNNENIDIQWLGDVPYLVYTLDSVKTISEIPQELMQFMEDFSKTQWEAQQVFMRKMKEMVDYTNV